MGLRQNWWRTTIILSGENTKHEINQNSFISDNDFSDNGDGNFVVAHADDAATDTKTSKTTTAKFNVTAGDFEISAVPTFDFGTKSISELMINPTLSTADTAKIAVADYRGAGSKWQLNASLGDFTNGGFY